jgi:hypothetical protein
MRRRLLIALVLAVSLAGGLVQAQKPDAQKPDGPITTDGSIPDPECPYYIIFGIPIPSGECFCLLFGTCG